MVKQYIGARYVPVFDGEYNPEKAYEPLTIVTYLNNSYTSKKTVPANTLPSNTEYWALTGNYNAQIEEYRQEVEAYKEETDEILEDLSCFATPQMYGAVADGVTDDSEAFRNALKSNKVVYVPEGTYLINTTVVLNEEDPDNAGHRSIISNGARIKSNTLVFDNNGDGEVRGFIFYNDSIGTGEGVKLSGWRSRVVNCNFVNQNKAIIVNDDAVLIENCYFAAGNIAISYPNESPLQTMTIIKNCTFQYQNMCLNQENDVYPVGIYVSESSFEANVQCWNFTNFSNWSFINCWFESNQVDSVRPRWCTMINTRLNGSTAGISDSDNWTTEIVGGNIKTTKVLFNNGTEPARFNNVAARNIVETLFKINGATGSCAASIDSSLFTFTKVQTGIYEITFPAGILQSLAIKAYPTVFTAGYASEYGTKTHLSFGDPPTYTNYMTVDKLRIDVRDDNNNLSDGYVVISIKQDFGVIPE